jgi:hypothetical protein
MHSSPDCYFSTDELGDGDIHANVNTFLHACRHAACVQSTETLLDYNFASSELRVLCVAFSRSFKMAAIDLWGIGGHAGGGRRMG